MDRITVYFNNGRKVTFDRDKASFKDRDGAFFSLSDNFPVEGNFSKLVSEGRAFINFDNVCFVREDEVAEDDD